MAYGDGAEGQEVWKGVDPYQSGVRMGVMMILSHGGGGAWCGMIGRLAEMGVCVPSARDRTW